MKINYRQLSVMLFMSFIALKFLVLPSVLYTKSGNMSWFVTLILMIIDGLFALLILDLMKKNQNKNINEFMTEIFGKFITKIFLIILAIEFVLQVAIVVKGLEFFVVENFYNNFTWILYVLPLIGLSGYMIYKGIRNIARVQEMFYISILVGCVYIACKSLTDVDFMVYLPLFKDGVTPLIKSGYHHLFWFGSSTFMLLLFGKVDFSHSKGRKTPLIYIIIAILLVQLMYYVFYGLFDMTSPTHTFALSDISQFSSSKSIIDELSWLVVSLWVVTQAIQVAVYGYCLITTILYLFNWQNNVPVIIGVNALIFGLGYFGSESINLEQIFFTDFACILTIITQYIIPIVLYLGYLIKNHKTKKGAHNEKVKINI